jgi:phage gpG-like protein
MSALDLSRIYENAAKTIAADWQSYIGTYMKKTTLDLTTLKTKEGKRNPNTGEGTLRLLTGKLFRSFSPKRETDGNIYKIDTTNNGFELTYGSSVVYAAIHEYGGNAGKNLAAKIPARPYFNPAIEKWKNEKQDIQTLKIKFEIIEALKVWLESQKSSSPL